MSINNKIEHGEYSLRDSKKSYAKLFITLLIVSLFLASVGMTQYLAQVLGYQRALGSPVSMFGEIPVYMPHKYIVWIFGLLKKNGLTGKTYELFITGLSAYIVALFIPAVSVKLIERREKNRKKLETIQGSAHWATREEIIQSALLPGKNQKTHEGVYVGAWEDSKNPKKGITYLKHNGKEHILVFAPTRSGKGVGLVLPTLLSWTDSALIFDIKGENWHFTSGWRQSIGQKVLRFEPTDTTGTCARFNPLQEIRIGTPMEMSDIQNVASSLVDPQGKGMDDHWSKTSYSLLQACIAHVLYRERQNKKQATLYTVLKELTNPDKSFLEDTLMEWQNYEHDPNKERGWVDDSGNELTTHPVVSSGAREMLNRDPKEASSVLSTAVSFLGLYNDPVVVKNTSDSTFTIKDLMNHETPVSLYLVVSPNALDRVKPLLRLIITQIIGVLAEEMKFDEAGFKHRLLLMMDEFPSLGKLEIFERALAYLAGYGMKCYLITQDLTQLQKAYSREESIMSNCHIKIAYAPNRIETAEVLSKLLGVTTALVRTDNKSIGGGQRSTARSLQHVQRALLTADEVMRIRGPLKDNEGNITEAGDMLIIVAGFAPILGRQILYFQNPTFTRRSKIPAPAMSDVISNE